MGLVENLNWNEYKLIIVNHFVISGFFAIRDDVLEHETHHTG